MNYKIPFLACMIGVVVQNSATAEIYQYHPSSRLYMGGGYNPYRPNDAFLKCIDYDGVEQVDTSDGAAVRTDAKIMMVKSRREFYEAIEFSATLGGGYLFFSGQGSVQMENESAFQSDSLSWLILLRSDYGRFVAKNPRLKTGVDSLSADEIYNRCGSEIVTEERRGVMVYALFTVSNLTESQKRKLSTQFGASFSTGLFSASAEASYKSFMSNVAAVSQVSVTVNAIGGSGITNLTGLIGTGDASDFFSRYNAVPRVMSDYIRNMTIANSVPSQFTTAHVSKFFRAIERKYEDFKSRQVSELFNQYQDIASNVSRLRNILYGESSREYDIPSEQRSVLQQRNQDYIQAMNEIYSAAGNCFDPAKGQMCRVPPLQLQGIDWPKRSDVSTYEQCQILRQFALNSGLVVNRGEYEMACRRNFAPHIIVSEGRASIEGWYRCRDLLSENF